MRNIIKQLRKQAGLRQEDMAQALGTSRQTIIAIENDKYNPTLELAMKIAKLLGRPGQVANGRNGSRQKARRGRFPGAPVCRVHRVKSSAS